jgi:GxxExxY protein
MNSDGSDDLNQSNKYKLSEETSTILRFAFQIGNTLGHGFREKTYENALVHLLKKNEIPYQQQSKYPIIFDGEKIDEFIPDLVVFGKIIVDLKTIDQIGNYEIGQMLNYLKVTKLTLGLIINFKTPKITYRRISL